MSVYVNGVEAYLQSDDARSCTRLASVAAIVDARRRALSVRTVSLRM